jgi:hypothetical protein
VISPKKSALTYTCFGCRVSVLAKKKKIRKFRATAAVKSVAREVLGTPPAVRREESGKREKKPKHKATLGKLLVEPDAS